MKLAGTLTVATIGLAVAAVTLAQVAIEATKFLARIAGCL